MLDLIIIGGGPAGLSAAINASSEGLKVALIERGKIGGQIAGTSLVENFFGFPHGVSGSDVAQWGEAQACKFGCQVISGEVLDIKRDGYYAFRLEVVGKGGNTSFRICRAVLYAGGLNYTRIPEFSQWEGDKVHYGSALGLESKYEGKRVLVIGGGNSAGQTALHLSSHGADVDILARREIGETMSAYLVKRITHKDILSMVGKVEWAKEGVDGIYMGVDRHSGRDYRTYDGVCIFAGCEPRTSWLPDEIERDDEGYVVTCDGYKTTMPGVFCVGDTRAGSTKRMACAVGEGAACVSSIHNFLRAQ